MTCKQAMWKEYVFVGMFCILFLCVDSCRQHCIPATHFLQDPFVNRADTFMP